MVKHKYTRSQNLKYLLSHLTCIFQVLTKKNSRKNGISVMIRVKDEEDWIAKSMLSLNSFADEVVVVNNNSTDNTLKEIEKICKLLKYKLVIFSEISNDICEVSNKALSLTTYRWIFRWDSDFIAYTSGDRNIIRLRTWLLSLPALKHYLIFPLTISFAGDLFHVKVGKETHSEGYIHTWSPKLKYVKKGKYEVLKVPFYYKIMRNRNIFFVHIGSAKSLKKIVYRLFWLYWQYHLDKFSNIDQFIAQKSKNDWNGLKPEKIGIDKFKRLILPVRKFDIDEFGEYPEIMQDSINKPTFYITYKDGKPFSRSDFDALD